MQAVGITEKIDISIIKKNHGYKYYFKELEEPTFQY